MAYYEYLYFVQMLDDGPVKIGRAGNPEKRLSALQTGSPWPLHIRALVRSKRPGIDEVAIHSDLAEHRLNGEWFDAHPDVMAYIERSEELERQLAYRDLMGEDADRRRLIFAFRENIYADWNEHSGRGAYHERVA